MPKTKFEDVLKNFPKQKVLVIGDVMLDQYTFGEVTRISPEAPVPVIHKINESYTLGGAANVASNLASLGAETFLVGFVGDDERKNVVSSLLKERGINEKGIFLSKKRPTMLKNRIVADGFHQIIRFDDEITSHFTPDEEKKVLNFVEKIVPRVNLVILSDYAKGLFSPYLTQKIIHLVKKNKKKIIADIKPFNKRLFIGIDLLVPNLKEAQEMTNEKDVDKAGNALKKIFKCNIMITLGENGIALFPKTGKKTHIPVKKVKVFDVSGAGDTVIAATGLALSSGADLEDAAVLGGKAAVLVVQKPGTATVSLEELESDFNVTPHADDVAIVPKLWGYEKWLENNNRYCCKLLVINKGYQCSLHYHKEKDEMFYVSKGHIRLESNGKISYMKEGNFTRITPGTKHRFRGIEDSVIIEVSTHHEESDSYRIEESRKVE